MLNRHFQEFIASLKKRRVRFLIVGGHAVAWHGYPRYTGDLDVFVAVDPRNAEKLTRVLADFGFASFGARPGDFLTPDHIVEIGREPMKIQILTGIDGVTSDECHSGRTYFRDGRIRIPCINFDELLRNKAASPRAKDKLDHTELESRRRSARSSSRAAAKGGKKR